jgi:hypothetical protein
MMQSADESRLILRVMDCNSVTLTNGSEGNRAVEIGAVDGNSSAAKALKGLDRGQVEGIPVSS